MPSVFLCCQMPPCPLKGASSFEICSSVYIIPKKQTHFINTKKKPRTKSPGLLPLCQPKFGQFASIISNRNSETALHCEIHMLQSSYLACFLEVDARLANCSLQSVLIVLDTELSTCTTEIDRTDVCLFKIKELVIAFAVLGPDAELRVNGVVLIDPGIAVLIVRCEILETVTA